MELGVLAFKGKHESALNAVTRKEVLSKVPGLLKKSRLLEHSGREIDASLIGIIGILVAKAKLNSDESLRQQMGGLLAQLTADFAAIVLTDDQPDEHEWACLQQLGSWAGVLDLEETSEQIAALIAQHRVDRSMWAYGGGKWSSRGYMEGDLMRGDYSLPYPLHIQAYLTEAGWKSLESWNGTINSESALGSFYDRIHREPANPEGRSES